MNFDCIEEKNIEESEICDCISWGIFSYLGCKTEKNRLFKHKITGNYFLENIVKKEEIKGKKKNFEKFDKYIESICLRNAKAKVLKRYETEKEIITCIAIIQPEHMRLANEFCYYANQLNL